MENKVLQVNEKLRRSNKSSRAKVLLQRSLRSELSVEGISELFSEHIVA